ncbi:MAG: hypothetical protein ABEI31_04815 [Halodesulfurarchaeum sp.]
MGVRPVESVPEDALVRDYDQLPPPAKHVFPEIATSGRLDVGPRVAAALETGEIINFTEYLRVTVEG